MSLANDLTNLRLELATWTRLLEQSTDEDARLFCRMSIGSIRESIAELVELEVVCAN